MNTIEQGTREMLLVQSSRLLSARADHVRAWLDAQTQEHTYLDMQGHERYYEQLPDSLKKFVQAFNQIGGLDNVDADRLPIACV